MDEEDTEGTVEPVKSNKSKSKQNTKEGFELLQPEDGRNNEELPPARSYTPEEEGKLPPQFLLFYIFTKCFYFGYI